MAKVILDPTGLYQIPPGCTPITTEVEWLQYFFLADCTYWVKGKRLCDWSREWLRAWDKMEAIIEEKQNPDSQPESLIEPISSDSEEMPPPSVRVVCSGKGVARKPAELQVAIDNSNSLPLSNLCLYINELATFRNGTTLDARIPALEKVTLKIDIPVCPELPIRHQGNKLCLTGAIEFRLADNEVRRVPLDSESVLMVNQMFRSGLDIDEVI